MSLGGATEVLTALGDKMPEGLWVGTRYWFLANDSALNKKFVADYFNKFNAYPSYNAHGAYSAVYAYKAAAEKAGSIEKMAIVKALEGLKLEIPTGVIEFEQQIIRLLPMPIGVRPLPTAIIPCVFLTRSRFSRARTSLRLSPRPVVT